MLDVVSNIHCTYRVYIEQQRTGVGDAEKCAGERGKVFDGAPYKAAWECSGGDGAKVGKIISLKGGVASHDKF